MLWIKALHIVFIASWFAGLFYLPRIYVNLAMVPADSAAERDRRLRAQCRYQRRALQPPFEQRHRRAGQRRR